jgi:uncharacterized BrkB/YihY/UPF0761 family membrane protein
MPPPLPESTAPPVDPEQNTTTKTPRLRAKADQAAAWTKRARASHPSVDVCFNVAGVDKQVAGGTLAGGVAYRLFFWILATLPLVNGALGFFSADVVESTLRTRGVDARTAHQIRELTQPSTQARWWLVAVGIWLVLYTGYLGGKSLFAVCAAVWDVPAPPLRKPLLASLSFGGSVTVILATNLAVAWIFTESSLLGLVALISAGAVPFTVALLTARWLPHGAAGLYEMLPGAVLFAVGVQLLQLGTLVLLSSKLANATHLYGVIGIVATVLTWLYVMGRLFIGNATVNAAVHHRRAGGQSSPRGKDDQAMIRRPDAGNVTEVSAARVGPASYRVVVGGELGDQFAVLFDGMQVSREDGNTVLTGPVTDQAHLAGILARAYELGLELISVGQVEESQTMSGESHP